jgi:hypothetical protein
MHYSSASHPYHIYLWFRVGDLDHIFLYRFPTGVGLSPGDKNGLFFCFSVRFLELFRQCGIFCLSVRF